jgi:hypothetical protein
VYNAYTTPMLAAAEYLQLWFDVHNCPIFVSSVILLVAILWTKEKKEDWRPLYGIHLQYVNRELV